MKTLTLSLIGALCAAFVTHATTYEFMGTLNGGTEVPPNLSTATGTADVKYDNVAMTLSVQVNFTGLLGTTTGAHIHATTLMPFAGNAGVAVPFTLFPMGVQSGSYAHTFDLTDTSIFNPPFLSANGGTAAGADAALLAAMEAGKSYVNIHTTMFPGGEIRGFLTPVPELGSTWAAGAAVAAFGIWLKRRNASAN